MAKGEVKGATISVNRRANYEYEILQRYDAGMVLLGSEVKSIREGRVNLAEGFARVNNGELFLYNVHIAHYGPARLNHEPTRPRKLLLHRRELDRLQRSLEEQPRSTVIPLRMYFHNGLVKLELGLAQGRRKYDKRQAIKQREANRDMQRAVRHAQR